MTDGWRSFFSSHFSLSFAGLGFLSFYLAGKLHLFDERGHTGKAWIALTPLTGALLTAISRTMDYRHHWQDVLVGSIVGLVFSYFAYRQYYPTLESPFSHKPYSPRIPRDDYRDSTLPLTRPDDDHTVSGGAYRRFSLGKGSAPYAGSSRPYAAHNLPYGGTGSHAYPPVASSSEVRLRAPEDDEETAIRVSPPKGNSPTRQGRASPKDRVSSDALVGYHEQRV
ncbi:hypothetical protein FRC11_000659 [Ceratobasidium sp. 423]|nr:hypothetical protein FRC11_000659 [Ceratobasidium sp. 423]